MGIVRDLFYAKKMSAGLKLPAPSSAVFLKRKFLANNMGGAGESEVPVSMTSNNYTDYGIDITVNADGTFTTTGSNTGTGTFTLTSNPIFSAADIADNLVDGQTYFLSGCPAGGSSSTYRITLKKTTNGSSTYVSDTGSGASFTYDAASTYLVYLNINKTVDVDGFLWKPMICLAS